MVLTLVAAAVTLASPPILSADSVDQPRDAFLENTRTASLEAHRTAAQLEVLRHAVVSSFEPRRGVPNFLWAERFPGARAPREQGLTAIEAARSQLLRYAPLYRLSPKTVARLEVSELHELPSGGAVLVGFQRAHDGVPFLRDELEVVMTSGYELVALTGSLATTEPRGDFLLDAPTALDTARSHLTGRLHQARKDAAARATPGGWTRFPSGDRARKVYFDDGDQTVPAFHLEVALADGRLFAVVVNATDGRILSRSSLARDAWSYRVFADPTAPFRPLDNAAGNASLPHPTGVPDGFSPPNVTPQLVTLDHGGLSTSDPWLGAAASSLSGNNINAYADLAEPDGLDAGDLVISPSGSATFDFTYDFAQRGDAGLTQFQASATQAFFTTNQVHDVFYDLGFDEGARNGQANNYGRGGVGNDPVLVEVHDFSGSNNANMNTRADGESSRMQLYLFDRARPSTLTATSSFFADGGLFAGVPNLMESENGWNTAGPMRLVTDADGGFGGCDPWADAGSYAGSVVLLDPLGCALSTRLQVALDAGVTAVVLNGACIGATDTGVIVTCLEADAGAQLHDALVLGNPVAARLQRPPTRPELDVAFDNLVVIHEYGHFISERLIGDSLGLANGPGRGMGEGWSDFIALFLSLKSDEVMRVGNDQWQGAFAFGGWSVQGEDFDGSTLPAAYFGVRRYPYSTDFTKNPLTFKHVGLNVPLPTTAPRAFSGSANNAEVHNTGEVWASALWEAQVRLLNRPGATFDGARAAMGRYFVAALKATPVLPTFIEARDAFLAVVFASSPTTDFPLVLDAFATRGLGILASSSDRRSLTNTPLAEDFTGQGGNYRLVSVVVDDTDDDCDADGSLDSGETGTLTLTLLNVGSRRLTQTQVRLSSPLTEFVVSAAPIAFPATDPYSSATITVPVSLARTTGEKTVTLVVSATDPQIVLLQNRFETTATLRLNVDTISSDTEDFEAASTAWTMSDDELVPFEDEWFIRSLTTSNKVLAGPNPRETALTWATSPPIAVGAGAFSVSFFHSFSFENPMTFFDGGRLEVSTDGTTFTAVPGSALSPTYTGTIATGTTNPLAGQSAYVGSNTTRTAVTANFGTQYAGRTVWLRFVIGADTSGFSSGWIVDDVHVTGATMPPFKEVVDHRAMCTNHPPTVSGTSSLSTAEREPVTLIPGTAFDRDQDTLTFTWMQTSGPSVQLTSDSFVAPDVGPNGGVLGFRVTVDDGHGGTDTDDMTVTVRNVNRAPVIISTNGPQMATSGDRVTFEISAEDPDGDPVSYLWVQEGASTAMLEGAMTSTPSFTAPKVTVSELISFKVVALDANKASDPAFVAIIIAPKKEGCQCSAVDPLTLLALGGLALLRRRRANRS